MPNLRIETNVSAEAIKDLNSCLAELSKAVSETTGAVRRGAGGAGSPHDVRWV